MLTLKRNLFLRILIWHLLAAAGVIAITYTLSLYDISIWVLIASATSLFLISSILIVWLKIFRPLKKIIQEMKALLTGKTYRRIMTHKQNEIGVLAHFFNEVTRNIEHISGDIKSHKRIQKELNMAQKIQQDLIPRECPKIPHLEIVAKTRPASEIGGDTFDFFSQETRTLFYIGDSTGHGIPAGIVMVMVNTLLQTFIDLYDDLTKIMVSLNKYIKPHLQTTMFMTMIFCSWEHESQELKWIGAGHEHIIHLQTNSGQIKVTPAGGIAIGMVPDNSKLINEQSLKLAENDFIIFYSDGITEAYNTKGEIYSLERLKKFIFEHATAQTSAEKLFELIAIDVGHFMGEEEQRDDMTLMVIKRTELDKSKSKDTSWT